jgi:hypothetical protein
VVCVIIRWLKVQWGRQRIQDTRSGSRGCGHHWRASSRAILQTSKREFWTETTRMTFQTLAPHWCHVPVQKVACLFQPFFFFPGSVRCRLVEECWHPQAMARPTFSEIIIRLDKIYNNCDRQGSWKESLKLWCVSSRSSKRIIKCRSVKSRIHTEPWTKMFRKKIFAFGHWIFYFIPSSKLNTLRIPVFYRKWHGLLAFFYVYISLQTRLFPGKLECCYKVEDHTACWLFFCTNCEYKWTEQHVYVLFPPAVSNRMHICCWFSTVVVVHKVRSMKFGYPFTNNMIYIYTFFWETYTYIGAA